MSGAFEPWAWSQAQQVCDASASAYTQSSALALADSLRDWLDAILLRGAAVQRRSGCA